MLFLVGRQELIEVKPECLTEKPQNLAKQQAGIDFCKERGMEYKILTERELEYLEYKEMISFLELKEALERKC